MRKYRAPGDPTERDDALEMVHNGNYRKGELSRISLLGWDVSPPHPDVVLELAKDMATSWMRFMKWPDHAIEASKADPNGDYWQEVNSSASYMVENAGWVHERDKMENPPSPLSYVKRLGQWHLADAGQPQTRCGSYMLGGNHAGHIPEHDRERCPVCFGTGDSSTI